MSDNDKKLETFYKLFIEFLNDLDLISPNDTTLLWLRGAVTVISRESLVNQYISYIKKYKDQIYKKNENFFIEKSNNKNDESFIGKEISKVRSMWPNITEDNKNCIWNYLILLTKISLKIDESR